MKISVCVITINRFEEIKRLLTSLERSDIDHCYEILILCNGSSDEEYNQVYNVTKSSNLFDKIRLIRVGENRGVSGGRDILFKEAKGDICLFLDDDVIFCYGDLFSKIQKVFSNNKVAALGFAILDTRHINYYPFKTKELYNQIDILKNDMLVSYFVGAAHAIRKTSYFEVGGYDSRYFYGLEEIYLSYKFINKNYDIVFTPEVIFVHKPSDKNRLGIRQEIMSLRNRILFSRELLPFPYNIIFLIIWSVKIFIQSCKWFGLFNGIYILYKGLIGGFREKIQVYNKLSNTAIRYIKTNKGRLCY